MKPWVEPGDDQPEKKIYVHLEHSLNRGEINWEVFAREHVLAQHESDIPARVREWQTAGDLWCYWLRIEPHDNSLDFAALCTDFMRQVERDHARRFEWLAELHTEKHYWHLHIALRGVDMDGARWQFHHSYVKACRFNAIVQRVKRKNSAAPA